MNIYSLSSLIASVFCVSLGSFVCLRKGKDKRRTSFGLASILTGLWSLFPFATSIAPNKESALFFARFIYIFAAFTPSAWLHFMLSIVGDKKNKGQGLTLIGAYGASIFILCLCFNPLFIKGVSRFAPHFSVIPGSLFPLFIFAFSVIFIYIVYNVSQKFQIAQGHFKNQLKYILLSFVFGAFSGMLHFGAAYFNREPFPHDLLLIAYTWLIWYAIFRYKLLDINIAITRAGIFTIVYIVILGLPFGIGYKLRDTGLWLIPLVVMALFATAGPFVFTYFQRKAEQRLRKEEFLAHQALNKLAQDMMRFTNLEDLLKLVVEKIAEIMKVNSTSIYLKDETDKHYYLRASWSSDNTPPQQTEFIEDSALIKDILLKKEPIVSEELKFNQAPMSSSHIKKLQAEPYRYETSVIVPVFKGEVLLGLLMLGTRRDNRLFTQEDLNLLLLLANQLVLAIENTQLIEKEKTFLAEKSRRDALADMAPGVAHQFDNRLQSILLTAEAQMLLNAQEDLHKLSPDKLISIIEQSQKTLDSISKDAQKGKEISDAVKSKGRAKLTYESQDLLPIIESAINRLKISRTPESLKGAPEPEITIEAEENLPKLFLKQSLIDDVLYNLVDNGRDAIILRHSYLKEKELPKETTPYQGKITIKVYKKDDKVIVTVTDNGIGMKEKELRRLFVPWFTTKATSIKGTGMGLHAIQAVIEDHKGKISVESEYGKGTTFTITFPIQEA